MKHCIMLIAVSMLVVLLASVPSMAVFPMPDSSDIYSLFQGYLDNDLIWFTGFETNNIRMATSILFADFIHQPQLFTPNAYHYPQFAPKLTSALTPDPTSGLAAARPMYVVLNYQQGPVLSTRPGDAEYSGLWQLIFIEWLPGIAPRTITNDAAPGTDPQGLPAASEAAITPSDIVFNCPVIAIGPLSQPATPAAPGSYRIPQLMVIEQFGGNTSPKCVRLPRYTVWYRDPITRKTWTASMPITDTSDSALAELLGANPAPGLMNMPVEDTQIFWVFNGAQPPGQMPLMSAGPSTSAAPPHSPIYNINKYLDYSPVMVFVDLDRFIPPYVTVGSVYQLLLYLGNGGLVPASSDRRINAHASFVGDYR